MRVLIVGCGYVGLKLGADLLAQGHSVAGLRRSAGGAGLLRETGIEPLIADVTMPGTLAGLPREWDWVVNCTSAGGGDAAAYWRTYVEGTRALLGWLAEAPPRKLVYTGSTGVYEQNDGGWVDEMQPAEPGTETSAALREAENLLQAAAAGGIVPAVLLRVAGIYGPGRGYFFRQFLNGEARLEGDGQRHLNMVHRDDVAGAAIAALERGVPGQIYNVVDDEPVQQRAFFAWLAGELRQPMPAAGQLDPRMQRRRMATDKRVSNRRLREELGYQFKFPTFREGYAGEIAQVRRAGGSPG